jgi:acyl-coenzyme A thioesterase PaaI-like protein
MHRQGRKVFVANAEMKVSFLGSVKIGEVLTCTAEVVSGGSRVAFVESSVVTGDGRLVGRTSSTYLYRDRN